MEPTMLYMNSSGFTTAVMFGGTIEPDTAIIRNTFDDDTAPVAAKVTFPVALSDGVYSDVASMADELVNRGYTKLEL